MFRIVLFLSKMDYGRMLRIVLFISFTAGTVSARLPESLAKAPSRILSETQNKSESVIPSWIADHIAGIVEVAVALALVVAVVGFCTRWCYRRKAPPLTRIDEESNPGSLVTYRVTDLMIATNNFSDSNLVGRGGFARVYRADLGGKRPAAVKRLLKVDSERFRKELSILLSLPRHPNLVNIFGICSDPGNQMIVLEYVANGTLFSHLHENHGGADPLSWTARKKIARQVAEALKHLHEEVKPPIIHRDVKSKNVLLEDDFSAKLADFGIAKLGPKNNQSTCTALYGTPGYMDPQYASEGSCSVKSDVYSFGVLLLELITGSQAVIKEKGQLKTLVNRTRENRSNRRTIMRIVDQSLPDHNNGEELRKMIRIANHCLESDGRDRPSMAEVVDRIGNFT